MERDARMKLKDEQRKESDDATKVSKAEDSIDITPSHKRYNITHKT